MRDYKMYYNDFRMYFTVCVLCDTQHWLMVQSEVYVMFPFVGCKKGQNCAVVTNITFNDPLKDKQKST